VIARLCLPGGDLGAVCRHLGCSWEYIEDRVASREIKITLVDSGNGVAHHEAIEGPRAYVHVSKGTGSASDGSSEQGVTPAYVK